MGVSGVLEPAPLLRVRLPGAPESTRAARGAVREALRAQGLDAQVDTAELLVSELVTNAVLHARSDLEVQVLRRDDVVRVAVLDADGRRPSRRRYGLAAGTGRGLGLVETMASAWGTSQDAGPWAKAVWFELSTTSVPTHDEGALYGEDWLALVDDL